MYLLALVNLASSSQNRIRLGKRTEDRLRKELSDCGGRGQQPQPPPFERLTAEEEEDKENNGQKMVNNNPRRAKPRGKVRRGKTYYMHLRWCSTTSLLGSRIGRSMVGRKSLLVAAK